MKFKMSAPSNDGVIGGNSERQLTSLLLDDEAKCVDAIAYLIEEGIAMATRQAPHTEQCI